MAHRPRDQRPLRYAAEVKQLGFRLRSLRLERGWTLDQATEHTGVELTHLHKIEAGLINVTLVTLVRLAEGFDLPMRDLFP